MNGAVRFLGTFTDIKEIMVIAGAESSGSLLRELLEFCMPERVSVYGSGEACARLKDGLEKSVHAGIADETGHEKEPLASGKVSCAVPVEYHTPEEAVRRTGYEGLALLFDEPDAVADITRLTHLAPQILAGSGAGEEAWAFEVWEAFRGCCPRIYICSRVRRYQRDDRPYEGEWKYEVLDWERREGPELSVIFPMYNVAPYLRKCIDSVTAWKADYVEYLFVDDGSPDECADIVREYAASDPRVKLLTKENGGCASARQFGLERAGGRYVGFIDPDDYTDEDMFRRLLSRAMTGSYEICWCGYNELYESTGQTAPAEDVLEEPYLSGTSDVHDINRLIAIRRIAIWRGIYLRSFLDREGITFHTDLRRFDDLPFKVETMARARSVVCIPEHLYYYRMARPGQDVAADDERLYVHFDIFKYLDDFIVPGGSQEQLGYLEIVKLHTHKWALEKMRDEFVKPYCEMARRDLLANMSRREGRYYIRSFTSPRDRRFFDAICRGWVWMVKWLIRRQ